MVSQIVVRVVINYIDREGNNMTKDELISTLEQFYTKEKQKQYGVLGIRIELI